MKNRKYTDAGQQRYNPDAGLPPREKKLDWPDRPTWWIPEINGCDKCDAGVVTTKLRDRKAEMAPFRRTKLSVATAKTRRLLWSAEKEIQMSEKSSPFSSFGSVDRQIQIDLWRQWKEIFLAARAGKAGALSAIERRLLAWDQKEALAGRDWASPMGQGGTRLKTNHRVLRTGCSGLRHRRRAASGKTVTGGWIWESARRIFSCWPARS